MARINGELNNFTGGEISPKLRRRVELEGYAKATEYQKNFLAEPHGEMGFRAGTNFQASEINGATAVRLMPFVYDSDDAYVLEFSTHAVATDVMRVFNNDGSIYNVDNETIEYVEKRLNELVFHVNVTTTGNWVVGSPIHVIDLETTDYTQYNWESLPIKAKNVSTVNGAWVEIVIAKPGLSAVAAVVANTNSVIYAEYALAQPFTTLTHLQWVQKNDLMWITSNGDLQLQVLTRNHTTSTFTIGNWAMTDGLAAAIFAAAAERPKCIGLHEGRMWLGNITTYAGAGAIDTLFASDIGDYTRFGWNDATPTDDDGLQYILSGENDEITHIVGAKDFLYVQTIGGGYQITSQGAALAFDDGSSRRLHNVGSAIDLPCHLINENIFFVERSGIKLRQIEYSFDRNSYEPIDIGKHAEHLTRRGLSRLAFARGYTDRFYFATQNTDGQGLSLTYDPLTNTNAWARYAPGDVDTIPNTPANSIDLVLQQSRLPRIEDIVVIPNGTNNEDTVMFLVSRGGDRYLETRISLVPTLPEEEHYTGDIVLDEKIKEGDDYEYRIRASYLDANHTRYATGTENITFTNAGAVGDTVATAAGAMFLAGDVGRRILGFRADRVVGVTGAPFGVATITAYNSATSVDVTITEAFEVTPVLALTYYFEFNAAGWSLLVPGYAAGDALAVVIDGADMGDYVIPSSGVLSFTNAASIVHFGFRYRGLVKTTNLQGGGTIGPSDTHEKNIAKVGLKFRDTESCLVGTDKYNLEEVVFAGDNDDMNRPTPLFNGEKIIRFEETWDTEKHIFIRKDDHGPCIIQAITPYIEVSND